MYTLHIQHPNQDQNIFRSPEAYSVPLLITYFSVEVSTILTFFFFNKSHFIFYFFINLFILFIYFWLHWVFVAVRWLSLVAASGGYSLLRCTSFSLRWLLLLRSTGSRVLRLQHLWLTGSRAQAQQLWPTGLVAPRHVGSSGTRAPTRVPCIGRWILNHCATREAPLFLLLSPEISFNFTYS